MATRLLPMLMMLAIIFRHSDAMRNGDDEEPSSNHGTIPTSLEVKTSLEMLARGGLHLESSREVGAHKFHDTVLTGLLQESSLNALSLAQQDAHSSAKLAPPASPPGGTEKITIEFPDEGDANGNHRQPIIQRSPDGGFSVTVPGESGATPGTQNLPAVEKVNPGAVTQQSPASDKTVAWVGKDFAGLFAKVPYTVVRIQTIVEEVNWFEPYKQGGDAEYTGTGWAVDSKNIPGLSGDPIFITNAHVVRNAKDVQIQLPALGQEYFQAYVPLICDEFDLAIVQLDEPDKFLKALAQTSNKQLYTLPVVDYPLILGLEVASVGFPLGSNTMKLSRGVVSGTEEATDFICYQTTAPISPGSSGGPLFALDTNGELRVIGVTFASSASRQAQNINFVVPAVAILQVLDTYRKKREDFKAHPPTVQAPAPAQIAAPAGGQAVPGMLPSLGNPAGGVPRAHSKLVAKRMDHFQMHIAPIDAVGIEGNQVLYESYGCNNGVFISKILKTSVFNQATPPLQPKTFLTAVDGVPIDSFGMGRTDKFLHDPVPFESLLMMKVKPGDTVTVTTCGADAKEKTVQHTLSMEYDKNKYQLGIHNVVEPNFERKALLYEIFAGITIMQMSLNHMVRLLKAGQPPTLGRWLLPENEEEPRLLITHVEEGSYASRVVSPGMVIEKINGRPVGTLQQYRDMKVFIPESKAWTLETDRGIMFATDFNKALVTQLHMGERGAIFLFTAAVYQAAQYLMAAAHQKAMQADGPGTNTSADNKAPAVQVPANTPTSSGPAPAVQVPANTPTSPGPSTFTGKAIEHKSAPSPAVQKPTPGSSLAQGSFDASERVTRLAKRRALVDFAHLDTEDENIDADLARRRARAAYAGFLLHPASAYVADEMPRSKLLNTVNTL